MKNGLVFSQSDARNFFITFSYTQIESEISDQVTNEYTPTRQIVTGKANERSVSMPSAKKQRKHSTTSRVPPYISFVLQLLAAALQQNKASLFVNVTHLILKGGDSRLKLLSLEANFHYFTSYLHSSVVLRNEYIRWRSRKYSAFVFNFWLVHSFLKPMTGVKFCAEGVWQNILGW